MKEEVADHENHVPPGGPPGGLQEALDASYVGDELKMAAWSMMKPDVGVEAGADPDF